MKHFLQILIVAIFISGCQDEYENIVEPDKSVAISADDNIASLILNVTRKDGSFDNLIDECNETSIKFPYTVFIDDDLSIQINSLADIEALYMEYFPYRDDMELQYPVTIIYSDYTSEILYDSDALEDIQDQYNNQLADDDIECIDFIYPVGINIYNTTFQNTDYLMLESDAEMFDLFYDLTDVILEIEFPVQLKTNTDEIVTINNNIALENEIERYKDACDENDHIEFEDDDNPFHDIITSNSWKIVHFSGASEQTALFSSFRIDFNDDFSVQVSDNGSIINGTWEYDDDGNISLELETEEEPLVWLNNEWDIISVNSGEIQLQYYDDDEDLQQKLTLQILE